MPEIPDTARSERIAKFLDDHGIKVNVLDLNRCWHTLSFRNKMYWIWMNQRVRLISQICCLLRKMAVIYTDNENRTQEVSENQPQKEVPQIQTNVTCHFTHHRGRICPHCGAIDYSVGSDKCPDCDEPYNPSNEAE